MIKSARQLKDLIRNLSKKKSADAVDLEWNEVMGAVHRLYALTESSKAT